MIDTDTDTDIDQELKATVREALLISLANALTCLTIRRYVHRKLKAKQSTARKELAVFITGVLTGTFARVVNTELVKPRTERVQKLAAAKSR